VSLIASGGTIASTFQVRSSGIVGVTGGGQFSFADNLIIDPGGHVAADLDSLDPLATIGPIKARFVDLFDDTFLDLTGGSPGATYTLVSASSQIVGAPFAHITPGYSVSYSPGAIRVSVVPEPALAVVAGSWAIVFISRRRRRTG